MKKPLLVMFVGVPGSGKTTFARKLASELGAIYINSHTVRLAISGSAEALTREMDDPTRRKANDRVAFRLMDYMAEQALAAGASVVYDANSNKRSQRRDKKQLAQQYSAKVVIVHIKTPHSEAVRRASERPDSHEVKRFSPREAEEIVEAFARAIEEPGPDEFVVEISGEIPFEQQYKTFMQALGD